jgi:hypothetical protein
MDCGRFGGRNPRAFGGRDSAQTLELLGGVTQPVENQALLFGLEAIPMFGGTEVAVG